MKCTDEHARYRYLWLGKTFSVLEILLI
jgi:hypothetical protein